MGQMPFSDISYERFLNEERLMGSRCAGCGSLFVPPRPLCIRCHGATMEWIEMSGRGRLAAFTCIAVAPPFMMEQGYGRNRPYCTGVVELEEGCRVDARIEGVDPSRPDGIKVGTPMKVKFLHREDAEIPETYLAFEPCG